MKSLGYDMKKDFQQFVNLTGIAAYAQTVKTLELQLEFKLYGMKR